MGTFSLVSPLPPDYLTKGVGSVLKGVLKEIFSPVHPFWIPDKLVKNFENGVDLRRYPVAKLEDFDSSS